MFRLLKLIFYAFVISALAFAVWFMPKYSYVQKNPSFCTQLTTHLFYCGNASDAAQLFQKSK